MNNSGTLHLKVKEFSAEQAGSCELLIRAGVGKLSFAIVNQEEKSLKVLFDCVLANSSLNETLTGLQARHDYLRADFRSIKVACETFHFSFVPNEIYSGETLPVLKHFISSTKAVKFVANELQDLGIRVISSLEDQLIAPILASYPHAKQYSQAEPFITSVSRSAANSKSLNIQFNSGTFELLIMNQGEVIYYNIFSAPTTDDFNYFLAAIIRQFDLNANDTEVLLSGDIEKYSESYRRVLKYFSRIAFTNSSKLFNHSEIFSLVPAHQFFSLLSLGLCE